MISRNVSQCANMSHIATLADTVTARCSACGSTWRYERHEALFCPMCAAHFTFAHFSSAAPATYVDFDAEGGATGTRYA